MAKRALITGSSRGIGRGIALALAEDGFDIALHCSAGTEKAEAVRAEILKKGVKCDIYSADLTDTSATERLASEVGNVDILILNASVQFRNKWENITLEECNKQLNCNFVSSLLLIQALSPYMKEQGFGRIITIGSVQEAKPHPDMLVYSATKSAQYNMVRSLALQLAPYGITVNDLAPGVIYTDRNVVALSDPEYAKSVTEKIPVGFYGEPQDCAEAARLLVSEGARYITGQRLYVDGGMSIK